MIFGMAKPKMISPKQFAAKYGIAYSTVMSWLRAKMIRGQVDHKYPFLWYEIPENATPPPARKPGPKPSKKSSKK